MIRPGRARQIRAPLCNRRHEPDLIDRNLNERTITHRIALYLEREFAGWHVDCEYNRNLDRAKTLNLPVDRMVKMTDLDARSVFPDIIVHWRERNEPWNLVVIEAKKTTNQQVDGAEWDRLKLAAFRRDLGYRVAVFLLLHTREDEEPHVDLTFIDDPQFPVRATIRIPAARH